jgi:nucleotide-binding universal stress UspA family protein
MEISLKEIADRLQNSVPSSISTAEILEGSPKQEIVVAAERLNADLIIMGSHGRRGLSRLLMGSVSRSVASQAHCSVWIIIPQSGIFENEIPQKQKSTSAV